MAYPSDVTADEWHFVAPYLCLMSQHALQRDYTCQVPPVTSQTHTVGFVDQGYTVHGRRSGRRRARQ